MYEYLAGKIALPFLSRFYNPAFRDFLLVWEESQYWEAERLTEYRWSSFQRLLAHAVESVPFYHEYFDRHGLSLADFRSFSDLPLLPVVGKEDIHKHGLEHFVSDKPPFGKGQRDSTSGTSGRPFSFVIDTRVVASRTARLIRENRWADWEPGERYVRLWGPHTETLAKKLFYDVLLRRVQVPAFGLQENADQVFALFHRIRPRIIEAYTSAAVDLAILCRNRQASIPAPDSIVVSAETLTPQHRRLIEERLGGRVFNRYGSREFGNIAHECKHGGFHINAESFHLEEEDHADIAGAKNLLVTFFDNFTMPFIRYRIGDLGAIDESSCPCGRGLPKLKKVEGRQTDFFRFRADRSLSFLFFNHFFEQYGGLIDRYQVEQTSPDSLLIRIVPTAEFSNDTRQGITDKLLEELGDFSQFQVEAVEDIARESSGKLKIYKPLHSGKTAAEQAD